MYRHDAFIPILHAHIAYPNAVQVIDQGRKLAVVAVADTSAYQSKIHWHNDVVRVVEDLSVPSNGRQASSNVGRGGGWMGGMAGK